MRNGKTGELSIAPIGHGWFGPCLGLPAFGIAAAIVDEGTDAVFVRLSMVGGLLVLASIVVSAFARSQRLFILLTATSFALAAGALVYLVTHMAEGSPVVFLDTSKETLFVVGASLLGALGAALVGARLHADRQRLWTRDAHHSALQRAGVLAVVTAVATTATLTPTRFFVLPPLMLVVGAVLVLRVTLRDRAFERRLVTIAEGSHDRYAIVPAEPGAPELPRVARWAGEISAPEHGYLVEKSAGGSYRDTGQSEEPLMSVAIGRIERAPRAVMVATIAASLVGLSLVLALMVTAPMISVPTSVRTLYGSTTRCRLHRPIWLEAKAVMPKDVVLYDVDANYAKAVEHTPPFRLIGYDRTRSTILSSTELFLALTRTNNDAEFLAFTAVNLLVDAAERHPDERASIDGRELHFSYALFPEAYKGRRWRDPSKKTVYRCSVNLDTAVRPPCAEVEVDDPDGDGGHMGTSNIRERDPHHAK